MISLRTPRLHLIAADADAARADADGDRTRLAALLDAREPPEWPPPLTADVLDYWAAVLREHPEQVGWWAWFFIWDEAAGARIVVGGGRFKGPPDECGSAEIGYSILDPFQRRGFATEAMSALIDWASEDPRVRTFVAHTFPDLWASIRMLEKLGMRLIGPGTETGTIRYERPRSGH